MIVYHRGKALLCSGLKKNEKSTLDPLPAE
jgi:hypothetical protein